MTTRFFGILAVMVCFFMPTFAVSAAESIANETPKEPPTVEQVIGDRNIDDICDEEMAKIQKDAKEGKIKILSEEEQKALDEKNELEKSDLSPNEKAKQDALTQKLVSLTQKLKLNEMQHFMVIYANYMVLSMVKAVQNDVSKAVDGCSSNNKSIESDMRGRFEVWKTAIADPMKEAEANVNNMVLAQTYISQAEVKDLFALVDETRAKNSSQFEKVPVTTLEACQYMMGKMDETQNSMIKMLQSTLVTYPDLLQKTQE